MDEEWRIVDIDKAYEVSNLGNVRHIKRKLLRKINPDPKGYIRQQLTEKLYYVHQLVAKAFINNPEKKEFVDHIDRNRSNNVVSNLRWATSKEQCTIRVRVKNISKIVCRLDIDNKEVVEEYESLEKAATWVLKNCETKVEKVSPGCGLICAISMVCRGTLKTAYGYKWKYKDEGVIENEIWKEVSSDITKSKYTYYVSTEGRLKGSSGRIIKGHQDRKGYIQVAFNSKQHSIHRLVTQTFLPNFFGKRCVNHKDGNKSNNRLYNLEWATDQENSRHACDNNLVIRVTKAVHKLDKDGNVLKKYSSISEAAKCMNVLPGSIGKALTKGKPYTSCGFCWECAPRL